MAEALKPYRAKRDFTKTGEPAGTVEPSAGPLRFVIHKHAARRLHYDLRLEHDGVLWSWAVTRGPSLDPSEKRLAVHVEDHPLDYGDFEGSIPRGEYGGGEVIVWDAGEWIPEMDPAAAMAKGHIGFELKGEKLGGTWHLVRLKPKKGETADNWLLMKADDAHARTDVDILAERPESVKSGLTVEDIKAGKLAKLVQSPKESAKPKPAKAKREVAIELDFIEPSLASAQSAPNGKDWLHEIKFDGYRLQAHILGDKVKLYTRGGLEWSDRFGPELGQALLGFDCTSAILDGEVVALDENGASSFPLLQQTLSARRTGDLVYYIFDLLHLDDEDLRQTPLIERKEKLLALVGEDQTGRLRYSQHFEQPGNLVFKHVEALGLEGIVSKKAKARYVSGRTDVWTKTKCTERQEFVIVGYSPSEKTGRGLRAIMLGYMEDGKLRYGGRVGTGFTAKSGDDLLRRMRPLAVDKPQFHGPYEKVKGSVWLEPKLLAEIELRGWSTDGKVRHAAYLGLREDKRVEEVVRESPADEADEEQEALEDALEESEAMPEPAAPTRTLSAAGEPPEADVKFTNLGKPLWPDEGVTKLDLLKLYEIAWPRMERFVVNRPLSLLRAPDGIQKHRFFQKHAMPGMSAHVKRLNDAEDGELLYIDSFDGLAALAQFGVVEIHIWGSTIDDLDRPDQMIFDLDPDEGMALKDILEATLEIGSRLDEIGLSNFVKPSGGKGYHIIVPLKPSAGWAAVKAFAHGFAQAMEQSNPKRYTTSVAKAARKGKVFIDYLRNARGSTTVCAWSSRAKSGATVSVPVTWDEVRKGIAPDAFSMTRMAEIEKRVRAADPWADFFEKGRALRT